MQQLSIGVLRAKSPRTETLHFQTQQPPVSRPYILNPVRRPLAALALALPPHVSGLQRLDGICARVWRDPQVPARHARAHQVRPHVRREGDSCGTREVEERPRSIKIPQLLFGTGGITKVIKNIYHDSLYIASY